MSAGASARPWPEWVNEVYRHKFDTDWTGLVALLEAAHSELPEVDKFGEVAAALDDAVMRWFEPVRVFDTDAEKRKVATVSLRSIKKIRSEFATLKSFIKETAKPNQVNALSSTALIGSQRQDLKDKPDTDSALRDMIYNADVSLVALECLISNALENSPGKSSGGRRLSADKARRIRVMEQLAVAYEIAFDKRPGASHNSYTGGGPFMRFCSVFYVHVGAYISGDVIAADIKSTLNKGTKPKPK